MSDTSRSRSAAMSLATGKLFAGNLVVTCCNLLRDIEIAKTLGASAVADYFFLALSLPIFLITLTAGSYRMVVVPLLTRLTSQSDEATARAASRLNWLNLASITAVTCACAVTLGVAYGIAQGAASPKRTYLIGLMLGVLPMYALSAFVELSQGALQVFGALVAPNLSRAALPAGIVLGAIWFGSGSGANGLIAGGTAGALLGATAVAWQLSRHGAPIRRVGNELRPSDASEFLHNFRALIVASAVLGLVPLIGQWLAALLGPGSVAALGYASRLTVGVSALGFGALVPVLLSAFAKDAGMADAAGAGRSFFQITTPFIWAGCGMTLGFWEISEYLIPVIYQHGQLTRADAQTVALVADCYAVQFPILLASTATTSLIAALSLNRVFIPINSIMLVSNVALTLALMGPLGAPGIALASSLTYTISLALQFRALARGGAIRGDFSTLRALMTPFVLLAIAAIPVFFAELRLGRDAGPGRAAGGVLILLAFFTTALVCNRVFVRRVWAGIRG